MSHLPEDYHRVSGTGDCDNDRIKRFMSPSVSLHVIPSRGITDTPLLELKTAQFNQISAGSHVWTSEKLLMTETTDIFTVTLPLRPNTTDENSPIFLPFPNLGCPSKAETDRLPQLPRDSSTSSTDSGSNPNSLFHQPSTLVPQPQSRSSHPLQTRTQPKLAFQNLRFAQAIAVKMASRQVYHQFHAGPSQQYHSPYPPQNGIPAHYVPQHPVSAPPPPPQQVEQVDDHPNDPRNEYIVVAHYRLESSGHLLGTGIINAVPAANGDVIFSRVVKLVNQQASDLSRDSYGLASAMADFAVTTPATSFSPATRRVLVFNRLAVRYEATVTMENSDAEPYDTKVKNTEELTMAMRMIAKREFRDVLVVYFSLGEPVVIQEIEDEPDIKEEELDAEMDLGMSDGGGKVKGKRTNGGGRGGGAKKARKA